jgi:putative phosphoesterase
MRVGLLSDTHDSVKNTCAAAALFRREGVSTLLHGGDVCGPAAVEPLHGFTVTFARGNAERIDALSAAVEALYGPGHLARWHSLLLDGYQVALLHGHEEAFLGRLIRSGEYAYVIHGHTHRRADRRIGSTRVINPGALGGIRREPRSVCILDLATAQARFFEVSGTAGGP